MGRWRRSVLLRAGFPQHRYSAWFVRQWGAYENPYLDDGEGLELTNTFVPLSFRTEGAARETVSGAAAVLTDPRAGNLVIEGGPGSGKSTLLRAHGVWLSTGARWPRRNRDRSVPFLIQLRKLAGSGSGRPDIASYLVHEILVSGTGMAPPQAERFLRYLLSRGRALVMLDGIDEVTADRYPAVLEAVHRFTSDHSPNSPTHLARIMLTCRRQNFLAIRDEWIPGIADQACSLAPLRDSDIFSYVDKLRPKFKAAAGPEGYLQAVRASGTLDLHRIPLILAMSAGLYARKDYFEIPSSIAKLYQAMIEEMLDRHRFKRDPGGRALSFQVSDKARFLRDFALDSARRTGSFGEFSRADLLKYAVSVAADLNAVADPVAFVEEIIERSGLLVVVGEARYLFAHRSIHEYLASERLRLTGDAGFLLDRAVDPEWRQVTQFFAAGIEQEQANEFLSLLARGNSELAAYCLAGAAPSDQVAHFVLDRLEPVDGIRLTALAAATMSPRVSVQAAAIDRLRRTLADAAGPLTAISGEVDSLLPLLNSLAGTNAAEIAGLVPAIIEQIPDDPRLVDPLWRCLAAPGIEELPEAAAIVGRLLTLATAADSFAELTRQNAYQRDFLTADLRRRAYPFSHGLAADHNLVTLLAWAEHLNDVPLPRNRYFEAKAAGDLGRIESARPKSIVVEYVRPKRVVTVMLFLFALITSYLISAIVPASVWKSDSNWAIFVLAAEAAACLLVTLSLATAVAKWLPSCRISPDKSNSESAEVARKHYFLPYIADGIAATAAALLGIFSLFLVPVIFAVGQLSPFSSHPLAPIYLPPVAVFGSVGGFFFGGERHHLYRSCPYVDLYDDPASRHWVVTEDQAPQWPVAATESDRVPSSILSA